MGIAAHPGPNLTSGNPRMAKYQEADWVRSIRHGVGHYPEWCRSAALIISNYIARGLGCLHGGHCLGFFNFRLPIRRLARSFVTSSHHVSDCQEIRH